RHSSCRDPYVDLLRMLFLAFALQSASSILPDPIAQGLFNHSQAACCRRLALARLNKPCRLLLEFKRVPTPLPIPHLRYPFVLEQLAKGYVLRGQGHLALALWI